MKSTGYLMACAGLSLAATIAWAQETRPGLPALGDTPLRLDRPEVPAVELKTLAEDDVRKLVEKALPSWDAGVLEAPSRENWAQKLAAQTLLRAVGDRTPPPKMPKGAINAELKGGVALRLDTDAGRVRYINPARGWDFARDARSKAVPEEKARSLAESALAKLGLPRDELGDLRVDTQIAAGAKAGAERPQEQFEMYRIVTVHRVVGKLPVYDSVARLAVNNRGEVARLKVGWPAFRMESGLELRDRKTVVEQAVQEIVRQQPLPETKVAARLVYATSGDEEARGHVPAVVFSVYAPPTPYQVVVPVAEYGGK